MSKVGALLFDLDGTIVDNMQIHLQTWVKYFGSLGVHTNHKDINKSVAGKSTEEVLRYFLGPDLTQQQIVDHYNQKETLYKELYYPVLQEIPGVTDLLKQAQSMGVPAAIASNAGIDNIDFVLDNLQIREFFKAVVSIKDVEKGKPDPDVFLLAAKRLGVDPGECLAFEDSLFGLEAAFRAGMKAVAITTAHSAADLKKCPAVIKVINNFIGIDLSTVFEDVPV